MSDFIDRAIATVTVQWGWRRRAVAFAAGAISTAALAPFHALPILFVTFPILVWLIDGIPDPGRRGPGGRLRPIVSAFATGWWFGFGYFLAGLYWIGMAFLVDAERFAWAMPIAVAALPAGLAAFTGFATALAHAVWVRGPARIVGLAVAWTASEWLRGEVLTGFPWNRPGQALAGSPELMQAAAYVGDLGLTFAVILIAAAPASLADHASNGRSVARFAPTIAAVVALFAMWGGGAWRLAGADGRAVPGVALRVVQPNIPQVQKWAPEMRSQTVARYLELSDAATSPETMGVTSATHLVWPETALPLLLDREPDVMAAIAALMPDDAYLITGALRAEAAGTQGGARFFNSVFVIRGDGTISGIYDKERLVPFGEFLPLQGLLEDLGLRQLTGVIGGFTAGTGAEPLTAGAAPPFSALICYEIIFPRLVAGRQRGGWLVNVTNDAWYGDTPGPSQHLAQARLRAVEQGLAVVRAANTGISAVIDPFGRVVRAIGYGQRGVIDSDLPAPLAPTFYAVNRDAPLAVVLGVLAGACLWLRVADSARLARQLRAGARDR